MHNPVRRLSLLILIVLAGGAVLLAGASLTSARTSAKPKAHAVALNSDDLPPAAGAPALTTCNGPTVNPDNSVTFCLTAPQASQVVLQLQSLTQKAPTGVPYPMTKGASGIWSLTVGPFDASWYGYAFSVDGVQMADPSNRNVSFFQVPPVWPGPSSAWSWVLVPGPAADYMAQDNGPHGAVDTIYYYSNVLHSQEQMLVYTPPGYHHSHRRYPVLYLYPGGGGADTDWPVNMRANFILDNLINRGKAKDMIVAMPEYNLRNCSDFTNDVFPQQLVQDVVRETDSRFRTRAGSRNRAVAGLSSGGGCVFNTLFKAHSAFAYYGLFSPNWPQSARDDLVQNHLDLLTNPAVNRDAKLVWITKGGPTDIVTAQLPSILALLDQYHVKYTYVPGTTYGAIYGHVWDTWRKALENFAPLLFRR